MPVPVLQTKDAPKFGKKSLGLKIVGIGTQDGQHALTPDEFEAFCKRHYPESPAMSKVLEVNRRTGIKSRSTILDMKHPLVDGASPPTIDRATEYFLREGVDLGVKAAQKAIKEWGGDVSEITHLVCSTCTNSANPGYDRYVVNKLGLNLNIERTLIHGVGCAGGLAALRNAVGLALGNSFIDMPARILVVTVELCSPFFRSELESVHEDQMLRITQTIFSDSATAMILSNDIGAETRGKGIYGILGWQHRTIPNTETEVGLNVHPLGYKGILTPNVPKLTASHCMASFRDLLNSVEGFAEENPMTFDWALHPGGLAIIKGIQKTMALDDDHLRASYDRYENVGNSSGAAVVGVMNRLREKDMGDGRDHVLAAAFGPGMSSEMFLLQRCR